MRPWRQKVPPPAQNNRQGLAKMLSRVTVYSGEAPAEPAKNLIFRAKRINFNIKIMYTTYHLTSAQEVSTDILDAIKATFKSRPITIIVEEDDSDFDTINEMKSILDERLQEDEKEYLSADESINLLNKKYGL
jgi:hypothetical protein